MEKAVDQARLGRGDRFGALQQLQNLGKGSVNILFFHPHDKAAVQVDRSGIHRVAGARVCRFRFAGQGLFINVRTARKNRAVNGEPFPGTDHDLLTHAQISDIHIGLGAVFIQMRRVLLHFFKAFNHIPAANDTAFFQNMRNIENKRDEKRQDQFPVENAGNDGNTHQNLHGVFHIARKKPAQPRHDHGDALDKETREVKELRNDFVCAAEKIGVKQTHAKADQRGRPAKNLPRQFSPAAVGEVVSGESREAVAPHMINIFHAVPPVTGSE